MAPEPAAGHQSSDLACVPERGATKGPAAQRGRRAPTLMDRRPKDEARPHAPGAKGAVSSAALVALSKMQAMRSVPAGVVTSTSATP